MNYKRIYKYEQQYNRSSLTTTKNLESRAGGARRKGAPDGLPMIHAFAAPSDQRREVTTV